LPTTMTSDQAQSVITLEGECSLTSAAELKQVLLQGLAAATFLRIDLRGVEQIDVPTLQLLWVAARTADRTGIGFEIRMSASAAVAARDAGFERFSGETAPR
jgi:anti-anti-sigma regulatory factor